MKTVLAAAGLALLCPVAAAACPVVSAGATEIYLSSADLAAPYYAQVVAGGDQDLSQCGYAGGYVIQIPDFSFHLSDISGPMQVSVQGSCDTVLLVNAPDGSWWFDDDSAGNLQPWMQVTVNPGRMDVWVGTYNGEYCDAQVVLN